MYYLLNNLFVFLLSLSLIETINEVCKTQILTSFIDLLYLLFFTFASRLIISFIEKYIRKRNK